MSAPMCNKAMPVCNKAAAISGNDAAICAYLSENKLENCRKFKILKSVKLIHHFSLSFSRVLKVDGHVVEILDHHKDQQDDEGTNVVTERGRRLSAVAR